MRFYKNYLLIAVALLLLTSCSTEKTVTQEQPESTDSFITETAQTSESIESETLSYSETESQVTTESASEIITTKETQEMTETTEVFLPYELDTGAELDLSGLSSQAKVLSCGDYYQETLVFDGFDPECSENLMLFQGFLLNSIDQVSRYKELYTETLERSIKTGTEQPATDEYQHAMELIDNLTEQYPLDDYMYLVTCDYDKHHWSKYTSFQGMDIVADGEMLKLIRRYETIDQEKYALEQTPALTPPKYLWIAAVPREFLSEEHYADWQQ